MNMPVLQYIGQKVVRGGAKVTLKGSAGHEERVVSQHHTAAGLVAEFFRSSEDAVNRPNHQVYAVLRYQQKIDKIVLFCFGRLGTKRQEVEKVRSILEQKMEEVGVEKRQKDYNASRRAIEYLNKGEFPKAFTHVEGWNVSGYPQGNSTVLFCFMQGKGAMPVEVSLISPFRKKDKTMFACNVYATEDDSFRSTTKNFTKASLPKGSKVISEGSTYFTVEDYNLFPLEFWEEEEGVSDPKGSKETGQANWVRKALLKNDKASDEPVNKVTDEVTAK